MQQQRGIERYAPLAGVVFIVLAILSFVIAGEPPDTKEGAAAVAAAWEEDDAGHVTGAILTALATWALVWFGGSLRAALLRVEGGIGRLAALAFAGIVIAAAGLLVNAAIEYSAAESAGDVAPEVTYTLAVFYEDFFFPMGIGFSLTLFAAGLATVRHGGLPQWLGIASIVIAVAAVTPLGFFAFLAALLWIAVVGVLLFLAEEEAAAPAAPAAPR
jgi:hypothetical protein